MAVGNSKAVSKNPSHRSRSGWLVQCSYRGYWIRMACVQCRCRKDRSALAAQGNRWRIRSCSPSAASSMAAPGRISVERSVAGGCRRLLPSRRFRMRFAVTATCLASARLGISGIRKQTLPWWRTVTGVSGAELIFNELLAGSNGTEYAKSMRVTTFVAVRSSKPRDGRSINLSIVPRCRASSIRSFHGRRAIQIRRRAGMSSTSIRARSSR